MDILAGGALLMTGYASITSLVLGQYGIAAIEAGAVVGVLYGHKYYVRRYEANRNVGKGE